MSYREGVERVGSADPDASGWKADPVIVDEAMPARAFDMISPEQRGDLINALVYVERSMARLDAGDSRGQTTVARAREDLAKSADALRRVLGANERTAVNAKITVDSVGQYRPAATAP